MSGKKKGLDVSDLEYEEELSQEVFEENELKIEQRRKRFEAYVSHLKHKRQYTLAGEIDRCLKKLSEGIETFENICQMVHPGTNANQKEKYDLKKEIKKLQRLREQIKSWIASTEIKDKTTLTEARNVIETQMERFKVVERETKTKAFSNKGLLAAQKQDLTTKEGEDLNQWLAESINLMQIQLDQFECEIESLLAGKRKRQEKDKQDRLDRLKAYIDRHSFHLRKLETLMRMMDNLSVDVNWFRKFLTQVKKIKEDMEYYLESNQEPEFEENEFIYADIDGLEEFDEGLVQQQALGCVALLTSGVGGLVGMASSTSGTTSPLSPMHSRNSSKDSNERRKSLEDSFNVVREVAVKANNVGPSSGKKDSPPKGVSTPDNYSPSSSSPPSQTQNQQNSLDNVEYLRKSINIFCCSSEGGASVIASALALVNTNCNGSGDSGEEQLHPVDSSIVSPRNQPNKHAMENSTDPTAPSSPGTLVTKSSVSMTKPKMASLAEPSVLAINFNLGLMSVPVEKKFIPPPAPLLQESGSNSLDASSSTVISRISNVNLSTVATSYLSSLLSSVSIRRAANINNNMVVASSEFTGLNSCGSTSDSTGQNSATNISDAPNIIDLGLADYASMWSNCNSTFLTQKKRLSQEQCTNEPGNSRDTASTSNMTDYIRMQPEQIPMNFFKHHESEPIASSWPSAWPTSTAQEFVNGTGVNPNHSDKTYDKKTTEVHMPTLLGVTPLGPVPLKKEHQFQLKMLETSFNHMPVRADSERMRQFLSRNPFPTPPHYPQKLLTNSNSLEYYQKLSTDALFFIFYYLEGTKAQYLAVKVLKNQSWRFHTKYMTWFKRDDTPKIINEEYEQGTYIYVDFEKWGQRKKGFVFDYRYLEDKPL